MQRALKFKILLVLIFGLAVGFGFSQKPPKVWRPNKIPANAEFAGTQACAECHSDKTKTLPHTMMGRALEHGATADILQRFPNLKFKAGPYTTEIKRQGNENIYSVSIGKETIAVPILYAFGQGHAGQTYIFKYKGSFYESRLSFYNEIKGLDTTIGQSREEPISLEDALGRPTTDDEIFQCFSCHSAGAATGNKLKLEKLVPGIGCENCHAPGTEHIALSKAGQPSHDKILNPGKLSPDDLSQQYCASCHRGVEDLFAMPKQGGLNNVRFQPYRIFNSKCYSDDRRISCLACHDVHNPIKQEAAFYDAKCNACHSPQEKDARLCKVGTKNCTDCHMPKVELTGSHYKFSDHRIRIVKPGEPYPF